MSDDTKPSEELQYPPPPAYPGPPLTHYMPPATQNMPPPTQNMPPPTQNMPPPTQNMPPPTHQPHPTTTTVTIQPISPGAGYPTMATVVVSPSMGSRPAQHTCPSCRHVIVTRVEKKTTTKTHAFAVLLCAVLMWPCIFIPYCTDSCKSIDHYCPNCNAYIGTYNN